MPPSGQSSGSRFALLGHAGGRAARGARHVISINIRQYLTIYQVSSLKYVTMSDKIGHVKACSNNIKMYPTISVNI